MELTNFDTFHFCQSVMAGIQATGYTVPTPIQAQAIPLIMEGKDVIGVSKTGTGKTAAFVLTILQHLWPGERGTLRALIISPTPKLAEQTGEIIKKLGSKTGLQYTIITGEIPTAQEVKELRKGPDIVAGCPSRILDFLWKSKLNLSSIEIVVIDEADRMSGLGLLPDIFNILMCITNKRQTLLFSATLPDNMRRLSRQFLSNPVTVQGDSQLPVKTTPHAPLTARQDTKTALLKEIISKTKSDSVLVYTRTKHSAKRVAQQMTREGYRVIPLKGTLSQCRQANTLGGLGAGSINILMVSDTKSDGISVSSIFRIINREISGVTGNDNQRTGRTGKLDKNGDTMTLVTSTSSVNIRALEQLLKTPLESLTL